MKRSIKKFIVGILSVVLMVTMIPVSISAQEYISNKEELRSKDIILKDPAPGNTYNISDMNAFGLTLAINDGPYAPDVYIKDGDRLAFTANWTLPDGGTYTSADTFTYDISSMGNIADFIDVPETPYINEYGVECATYSITNGILTVHYNDDYLSESTREGRLTFNAVAHIKEDSETITGNVSYTLPGDINFRFKVRTDKGLELTKTATKRIVEIPGGTHEVWIDYVITITAKADNTDIKIFDQLSKYSGWNETRFKVTMPMASINGGTPFEIGPSDLGTGWRDNNSMKPTMINTTYPALNKDDVMVITYSLGFKEADSPTNGNLYNNDKNVRYENETKVSSNETNTLTADTSTTLENSVIVKSAKYIQDTQKIRWYIAVYPGEYTNLTVRDIPLSHINCSEDTPVDLYFNNSINSVSGTPAATTTYGELLTGYNVVWPEGNKQFGILVFESDVNSNVTFSNKAEIVEPNKNRTASISILNNEEKTKGTKKILSAELLNPSITSSDHGTILIRNEISIKIGKDAVEMGEDFNFYDSTGSQMNSNDHDFHSDPVESIVNENGEDVKDLFKWVKTSNPGSYNGYRLTFSFVDTPVEGNYKIVIKTILKRTGGTGGYRSNHSANALYWKDSPTTYSTTTSKWDAYTILSTLSKSEVTNNSETGPNEILWKISVPELKYYFDGKTLEDYSRYSTIVDTLPKGLKLERVYWEDGEAVEYDVEPTIQSDKTTLIKVKARASKALYILSSFDEDYYGYSYLTLSSKKTYINNAYVEARTEENGPYWTPGQYRSYVEGTIGAPVFTSKTVGEYDPTISKNLLDMQLDLNPDGLNLIGDEVPVQTYSAKDTMSSTLTYEPGTMYVNGVLLEETEYGIKVEDNAHTVIIYGLEDETSYHITYKARVTENPGSVINSDNTYNSIEIPDITYNTTKTVSHLKKEAVVQEDDSFTSEAYGVRVYKYDDTDKNAPVKDAKFTIYDYGTGLDPAENGTYVCDLTTDATGFTEISTEHLPLRYGTIYGVKETQAPDGYVMNDDIIYFIHKSTGATSLVADEVIDVGDSSVFVFEAVNHKKRGDLIVTKTVTGDPGETIDTDKAFNFTVKLSDSTINGKYGDMEFNAGVATFSLKHGESSKAIGIPEGIKYTVTEEDYSSEDYFTTSTGSTDTIVDGEEYTAAFINKKSAKGNLSVSKTVDGNDMPAADTEFSFTVELSDASITGTYGDMEFADGVATISLKNGETKTAENLPNGITYEVSENNPGTDYDVTKDGETGTIESNITKVASFTNTRNTYGSLTVTKTVDGNAGDTDKEFSFTVTLTGSSLSGTFGDMNFDNGVAEFKLKDGESLTAENLPNGTAYTVTEEDYTNDGYTTRSENASGTIVGKETKTASFTNTRNTYGNLSLTKTLDGNDIDPDKSFIFIVKLSDTSINGIFGDMNFSNGVAEVTVMGGQTKTANNLPNGTTFEVSENDYSSDGYTVEHSGDTGSIIGGETSYVSFKNIRNTYGDLEVTKTVDGNAGDTNKEFKFTVTLSDESINGLFGNMDFVNGVSTFYLKDSQSRKATNLPNGITYTVTEDSYVSDGYSTSSEFASGKITGDSCATASFTNTRNANGTLTISKTINGNDINADDEFSFTVTLNNTSVSGVHGDMTFNNGVAEVTLKGGQTKTATDIPNGTTYRVVENVTPTSTYELSDSEGTTGTISETVPSVASFTNTRNTYGSLTVTKTVDGNAGDTDKEFSFTVTLTGSSLSGTFGDMDFNNGVAEFKLKDGESLTAENLPNGTAYTVTEEDYTNDGYTTRSENASGTIVGKETKTVSFTNTRNAEGSLRVKKTLEGNDTDSTKNFEFEIVLTPAVNDTYSGVTFTDGKATIYLKGGETKLIEGLPNGTNYSVNEKDYSADGYETVSSGSNGTIVEAMIASAEFTNKRNTYGELVVSKVLEDQDGNALTSPVEFTIKVKLSDTSINGTYDDMTFVNGVATLSMKGNESKKATNLPNGITYTVEEENNSVDGYSEKTTDSSSSKTGTIKGGDTVTAIVTNEYKPAKITVELKGKKTLEGFPADSTITPLFTFVLSEGTTELDSTSVYKEGDYSFEIEFDKAGSHTYTVKESVGSDNGITYDDTEYTVTIDVEDDLHGNLTASISGSSTTGDDLDFNNIYKAKPVSVKFGGIKSIIGKVLEDNEFSFTLTGHDDSVSETVKNAADGTIAFTEISYDTAGVFRYTVKEDETSEPGIVIDTKEYNFTVTVTDPGDGQLVYSISGDTSTGKGLDFENTFKYGSLQISKTVTGNLGDKNKDFTFTVTFDCAGIFEYTGSYTGTVSSGDSFTLKHGESITIERIPDGVEYEVVESDNSGYVVFKSGDTGVIVHDSTANADFVNARSTVPYTGDHTNMTMWIVLAVEALIGMVITTMLGKKKKHSA